MNDLFEAYLVALAWRRRSRATVVCNNLALRHLDKWLASEGISPPGLDGLACERFFAEQLDQYAVSTVRHRLSTIRAAYHTRSATHSRSRTRPAMLCSQRSRQRARDLQQRRTEGDPRRDSRQPRRNGCSTFTPTPASAKPKPQGCAGTRSISSTDRSGSSAKPASYG